MQARRLRRQRRRRSNMSNNPKDPWDELEGRFLRWMSGQRQMRQLQTTIIQANLLCIIQRMGTLCLTE